MEKGWIRIIVGISAILWIEPKVAAFISVDAFIAVPHVPGATTVTIAPFVFENLHCAGACLIQGSCQGFLMALTEAHPCRLLIGLDGTKTAADPQIEAFITLYYNGVKHCLRTIKQSWTTAKAYCQSRGQTMISYPLTMDKRNWMIALIPSRLHIGAKKNWGTQEVYDINTNSLLTVDWYADARTLQRNALILTSGKFDSVDVHYAFDGISVICAPIS